MRLNIALIDTQTSNIKSVYYALLYTGFEVTIIKSSLDFKKKFHGLVFPGIGSFQSVIENVKKKDLENIIKDQINLIPSLFICVGMQILFEGSDEFGFTEGLGVLEGKVKKIPKQFKNDEIQVPSIGWNRVTGLNLNNQMSIIEKKSVNAYYFTHSFYCDPDDKSTISSTTKLKSFNYCSSISLNKINALQFHPEKSGLDGLKLYKNFFNVCKLK